jgi:hypothetical protein
MAGVLQDCIVLNLQIGVWSGHKFDKPNTQKVIEDTGAAKDALRVNKHLMPKEVLAPVTSAASTIRVNFYKATLPWKDNGDRLIPRKAYMKFIPHHSALADAFRAAVDDFLDKDYPRALEQAEFRMGESYDANDYPTVERLRRAFYVGMDVDAVPEAKDWRLKDDASIIQGRIDKAMAGLWEKIADPLEALTNALKSDDGRGLKNATLNNLKAIMEALPLLNFTHSEDLMKIGDQIEKKITRWEIEDMRGKDHVEVREQLAADAEGILDTMKGFMAAMGGAQ